MTLKHENQKPKIVRWPLALCLAAALCSLPLPRPVQAQFCCAPDSVALTEIKANTTSLFGIKLETAFTAVQAVAAVGQLITANAALLAQIAILRSGMSSINGTNTGIAIVSLEKDKILQRMQFQNAKRENVLLVGSQILAAATVSEVTKACLTAVASQSAQGVAAANRQQTHEATHQVMVRQCEGPESNCEGPGTKARNFREDMRLFGKEIEFGVKPGSDASP